MKKIKHLMIILLLFSADMYAHEKNKTVVPFFLNVNKYTITHVCATFAAVIIGVKMIGLFHHKPAGKKFVQKPKYLPLQRPLPQTTGTLNQPSPKKTRKNRSCQGLLQRDVKNPFLPGDDESELATDHSPASTLREGGGVLHGAEKLMRKASLSLPGNQRAVRSHASDDVLSRDGSNDSQSGLRSRSSSDMSSLDGSDHSLRQRRQNNENFEKTLSSWKSRDQKSPQKPSMFRD